MSGPGAFDPRALDPSRARAWLDEHFTEEFRREGLGFSMEMDGERLARMREWNGMLADARFAAISGRSRV